MSERLPEVVYTPESPLRHPYQLLRSMVADLKASRELAWRLFIRNISAMYRQTVLGYFWAFLPPIFTTLTFVFLNSQKVLNVGDTSIPYPVYVMTGTLLWQVFIDALNSPIQMVSSSKAMLIKINFPKEALILAGLYGVLFNFMVRFILLFGVLLWFRIAVPGTVFLALVGILALIMFGLMTGILLTPLAILYQDIERGLAIFTSMWFFVTPVVYPPPTSWPASLIVSINPVSPLLITTREWLTTGSHMMINSFIIISLVMLFLTCFGWVLFRIAMPHIAVRVGA